MPDSRVLVVDDHPILRHGIAELVQHEPGFEVCAEAGNATEALEQLARHPIDLAIVDLSLAGLSGIDLLKTLRTKHPAVRTLVMSMHDETLYAERALRAGARGYVLKGAAPSELERAIRGVATGEAVFGPGVAERVLQTFTAPAPTPAVPFPELTDREREVLDQLAAGRSNGAIAKTLALSPRTVANHVSSILTKLHATDRTQAALRARDAGLGS